jgi:hypothetical protein
VFLNVPYDLEYEPLFLAFIAGLCAFGLTPRAAIELPGSTRRLGRILKLLHSCRYSFHDLSRVEMDASRSAAPRFNMPFELGLAVSWAAVGGAPHDWFVFEAKPLRLLKSLSDLNGSDPEVHGGRPTGVLRAISNVLSTVGRQQPTIAQLEAVRRGLQKGARELKRRLPRRPLFEPSSFEKLLFTCNQVGTRDRNLVGDEPLARGRLGIEARLQRLHCARE